jgi:putative ABC transport system ATP-binding protein
MNVLEAQNLKRTYQTGAWCVDAVRGVDLRVEQGAFVAIMGPSGSGKSTLLYMLGGIETPTSGKVLLEGTDLAVLSDEERTLIRRRRIGFVFQSFNLLPTLTAEENVLLPLRLDGVSLAESRRRAAAMLDVVGLSQRGTHFPDMLSGGEQQRVAVARSLVIEPAILLADEPTGNLDSKAGGQITSLLRGLVDRRQQTVVIVTHDPTVAAAADRIVHLRDGLVESDGEQPGHRGAGDLLHPVEDLP